MRRNNIWLDLDGTWVDLYGIENWLEYLLNENVYPYKNAKPLVNLSSLAKTIHLLQNNGFKVGIITWLSKNGSVDYDNKVSKTKMEWLKNHIPSVKFDEIKILKYGTPKYSVVDIKHSILFDDEEKNRIDWENNGGLAFSEKDLIKTLKALLV